MTQLEKGLPPNSVVPQLKQKVEKMKEKVSLVEMISQTFVSKLLLDASDTKLRTVPCLNELALQREERVDEFNFCGAQTASHAAEYLGEKRHSE